MKRTPLVLLAVLVAGPLVLLAGCDAAGPGALDGDSADARPAKVDVCHYDADADAYHLINVAAPSLPAHRAHGDALPGEAVPTMPGYAFDEVCAPQPVSLCPFEGGEQFVGTFQYTASSFSYPVELTILGCPDPGEAIADVITGECASQFFLLEYSEAGFSVQEDGSTGPACADGYEFDFVYDETAGSLDGTLVGYLGEPSNLSATFDLELVP